MNITTTNSGQEHASFQSFDQKSIAVSRKPSNLSNDSLVLGDKINQANGLEVSQLQINNLQGLEKSPSQSSQYNQDKLCEIPEKQLSDQGGIQNENKIKFDLLQLEIEKLKKQVDRMLNRGEKIELLEKFIAPSSGSEQRNGYSSPLLDLIKNEISMPIQGQLDDLKIQIFKSLATKFELNNLREITEKVNASQTNAQLQFTTLSTNIADIKMNIKDIKIENDQAATNLSDFKAYSKRIEKTIDIERQLVKSCRENQQSLQEKLGKMLPTLIFQSFSQDVEKKLENLKDAVKHHQMEQLKSQLMRFTTQNIEDLRAVYVRKDVFEEDAKIKNLNISKLQNQAQETESLSFQNTQRIGKLEKEMVLKLDSKELEKFQTLVSDLPSNAQVEALKKRIDQTLMSFNAMTVQIKEEIQKLDKVVQRYDEVICEKASKFSVEEIKMENKQFQFGLYEKIAKNLEMLENVQVLGQQIVGLKLQISEDVSFRLREFQLQQEAKEEQRLAKADSLATDLPQINTKLRNQFALIDKIEQLVQTKTDKQEFQILTEVLAQVKVLVQNCIILQNETVKLNFKHQDESKQIKQSKVNTLLMQVSRLINSPAFNSLHSDINSAQNAEKSGGGYDSPQEDIFRKQKMALPPNEIPLLPQTHNSLPISQKIKRHFANRQQKFKNEENSLLLKPNQTPQSRKDMGQLCLTSRNLSLESTKNPVIQNQEISDFQNQYIGQSRALQSKNQTQPIRVKTAPTLEEVTGLNLNVRRVVLKTMQFRSDHQYERLGHQTDRHGFDNIELSD